MESLEVLQRKLHYWQDKLRRVRRDPDMFGTTQPQICKRNIKDYRAAIKAAKAGQ